MSNSSNSLAKKQSPMKLKVLPQTVKNSQLGSYKQAVQALSSNKNSIVKNSPGGGVSAAGATGIPLSHGGSYHQQ